MQTTVRGELFPSGEQARRMDEFMRLQSSAMRYAFERLCEGKSKAEIEADLKEKFPYINSRYRRGGYFRAKFNYESALKLVKAGELESPQKVVFGGRKNLERRKRNEITNEEWKRLRNNQLYSRGDKSKNGNLNLRIVRHEGGLCMRVNIGDHEWIHVPVYLPNHVDKFLDGEESYGVRILRKGDEYELRVSFEENHETKIGFEKGAIGVDFNHRTIDLAVTDKNGQLKDARTIDCSGLTSAGRNKRRWLAENLAKEVAKYARYWRRGLVIEKLNDVARCRKNQHEFAHRKFLDAVKRRAKREGIKVRGINPAYTSVIGKWKYASTHHVTSHQASALVIARRGKGIHEKLRGLKTLALKSMEERKGREGVTGRRFHSWSLWSLIGNPPSRKGAEHTNPEPKPRALNGRGSDHEVFGMESSRANIPTERSPAEGDSVGGKTVTPGSGPPALEAVA